MSPVVVPRVTAPIGNSDHHAISFDLIADISIPNITISCKVYLKSRADWHGVNRDLGKIKWTDVFRSEDKVGALNSVLINIINRRIPTKVIMSKFKDKVWFDDDCRRAYNDKQTAYKLWAQNRSTLCWDNFVRVRSEANIVYAAAEADYRQHLKNNLSGISQPHKWWSTLKNFFWC